MKGLATRAHPHGSLRTSPPPPPPHSPPRHWRQTPIRRRHPQGGETCGNTPTGVSLSHPRRRCGRAAARVHAHAVSLPPPAVHTVPDLPTRGQHPLASRPKRGRHGKPPPPTPSAATAAASGLVSASWQLFQKTPSTTTAPRGAAVPPPPTTSARPTALGSAPAGGGRPSPPSLCGTVQREPSRHRRPRCHRRQRGTRTAPPPSPRA